MSKFALMAAALLSVTLAGGPLTSPLHAAPAKKTVKRPAKKPAAAHKPVPTGTLGTHQMAGGDGVFGETYTVTNGGQYGPVNLTLTGAEYSVTRFNMSADDLVAPKVGEKLLVVHYRLKNPNTSDLYYSGGHLFQTVTSDDQTADDSGTSRREGSKEKVAMTMKPGQGIDNLVTYAVIPAKGPLPKIILHYGRVGTKEEVIRYVLGQGKNVVKPIPAPYADPSDPAGATALTLVPAKVGTTYQAGFLDVSLDAVAFAPGPFGELTAEDGKRFLVATVTVTNKEWGQLYFKDGFTATLRTSDDEKVTDFTQLKGKRDEAWEGQQLDADEAATVRLVFVVAKDATAKTLTLAENVDNSGGLSHALVYDLSGVK